MTHVIQVHFPTRTEFSESDYQQLEGLLGYPPLRLEKRWIRKAPWITVDGRMHSVASWWLRSIANKYVATELKQRARDLGRFIEWLINDRQMWAADEWKSDVWLCADYDPMVPDTLFIEYLTSLGDVGHRRWNQVNTTLKDFFVDTQTKWQVPLPMQLTTKFVNGRTVLSNNLQKPALTGPAGLPLHPEYCDVLVRSAMRLKPNGSMEDCLTASRDAAWIHFLLATGMRHFSARMTTIFEIPPAVNSAKAMGLNEMFIPDATAKGKRGGAGFAFEWRLEHVRTFIKEKRKVFLKSYEPKTPKIIIDASGTDTQKWTGVDTSTGEVITREWNRTGEDQRLRMVVEHKPGDDEEAIHVSPIIFLSNRGRPISESATRKVVADAREFARKHWASDFPAKFRVHDCRHTMAVHLCLLVLHNVLAQVVKKQVKSEFKGNFDSAVAVSIVQRSLGHTTDHVTTSTYLQHLSTFIMREVEPDHVLKEWSR